MAKISNTLSYPGQSPIEGADYLIGTAANSSPIGLQTKTFTIQGIADFVIDAAFDGCSYRIPIFTASSSGLESVKLVNSLFYQDTTTRDSKDPCGETPSGSIVYLDNGNGVGSLSVAENVTIGKQTTANGLVSVNGGIYFASEVYDANNALGTGEQVLVSQTDGTVEWQNYQGSGLEFQGAWDADLNSPDLFSVPLIPANTGKYWIVSVAGATPLDTTGGVTITDWEVGDWAIISEDLNDNIFWDKIDNSSVLTGQGTPGNLAIWVTDSELGDATVKVGVGDKSLIFNDLNGNLAGGDAANAMGTGTSASGQYSTAMGNGTQAIGIGSTAIGTETTASGNYSTAMGELTTASGWYSTAMGKNTTASGWYSTAMGQNSVAKGDNSLAAGYNALADTGPMMVGSTIALGTDVIADGHVSVAMGNQSKSTGDASTAMGFSTLASGVMSTAMGRITTANGDYSTSMGSQTTASGDYSTAMGDDTTASGDRSTAMGNVTTASGSRSTAMGNDTTASGVVSTAMGQSTEAGGEASTAMGRFTTASALSSTAMGEFTTASGDYSLATGWRSTASGDQSFAGGGSGPGSDDGGTATDKSSFAFGIQALASGQGSTCFGRSSTASGLQSFVGGVNSEAGGAYSFAYGQAAKATGGSSLGIGLGAEASNTGAIALGQATAASGLRSVSIGLDTAASAEQSTSIGIASVASGLNSVALGTAQEASGVNSIAIGGLINTASGTQSISIGQANDTTAFESVAIGDGNTSSGNYATLIGYQNTAVGTASFSYGIGTANVLSGGSSNAFGVNLSTTDFKQTVLGSSNLTVGLGSLNTWVATDNLLIIGNGEDNANRSNALEIRKDGELKLNTYGTGIVTGTATRLLAVDVDGRVIERSLGSAGITGGGTLNKIPLWTPDGATLGDSMLSEEATPSYDTTKSLLVDGTIVQKNLGGSTYIGLEAGISNVNPGGGFLGDFNVAIGDKALTAFTSGLDGVNPIAGENVSIGARSLFALISGTDNIAIGADTARTLTTGRNNIAIGKNSLLYLSDLTDRAIGNVAIGFGALSGTVANQIKGQGAIAIGNTAAGDSIGEYTDSVIIGNAAVKDATADFKEGVAIGKNAGNFLDSATTNINGSIFIGMQAGRNIGRATTNPALSQTDIGIGKNAFFGSAVGFSSAGANIAIGTAANGNNTTLDVKGSIMIGHGGGSGKAGSYATIIGTQQSGTANESLGVMGAILGGYSHSQNAPQGGCILGRSNTVEVAAANSVAVGGYGTTITGANSVALGTGLNVGANQVVVGKFNVSVGNAKFVVGIGTAVGAEANGFEVLTSGKLRARKYGVGTFTDTAAFNLGVKSNGELVETPRLPGVADNYADDAAAAAAGIGVGNYYHTNGVVKINITT